MPPAARRPLVLGTAGHIDHGKTALVEALTGQNTDRLPEEKARGITIELGFATLALPDGTRLAVVDVPGHERFVRTMVAGASGLDLVLLVVSADEGVMPQTREHLAICRLLGVEHGLVVLSKCDLADEEMRAIAEQDVREALAGGPLAEAPIVPASAVTGEGIDALRSALARLVDSLPTPEDDDRPARLFVDRVFEKHGFGAIATGTWSGRPRATGASVVVEPGGRRARIRGLERHGEALEAGIAGARIALNLQGLAVAELSRGDLVCEPDALIETRLFDAELEWLSGETFLDEPTSVELLTGTCERRARLAPIGREPLAAGERGFVRVHVEGDPLCLVPGDRFVVRGFARESGLGATRGGGRVLDVDPPLRRRRDPRLAADLERLAAKDRADALLVRIERAGLAGTTTGRLARETGRPTGTVAALLAELEGGRGSSGSRASADPPDRATIVRLGADRWLVADAAARLSEMLGAALDEFHAKDPLQPGMPRATLAGRLPTNVPAEVASALIAREAARGTFVVDEQRVRRASFRSTLDAREENLAERLLGAIRDAGLEAPSLRNLSDALGCEPTKLRGLAHHLEREGRLVAAPEELFFAREDVDRLIERVVVHFASSNALDTQTLKGLIGTSRRTAMPLMALLDELQITRRDGSLRRLLQREPRWPRSIAK